jgi:hypothetical protein
MELQFIQYVIKKFNALNTELSKPWAQEAGLNDYLAAMGQLASSFSHFPEQVLVNQGITGKSQQKPLLENLWNNQQSLYIIRDISDMVKHGKLSRAERNNEQEVFSVIEVRKDGMFRFLRNIIEIKYIKSGNTYDFIIEASSSINYLINEYGFNSHNCVGSAIDCKTEFSDTCALYFQQDREIVMSSTKLRFLKRNKNNDLVQSIPPVGRVEWYQVKNDHDF